MANTTDWIYGIIFSGYVACFIFIAAYMMVRKKREGQLDNIPNDPSKKEESKVPAAKEDKKNL